MPDLPAHPDSSTPETSRPPDGARRRRAAVIAAVVLAVLAVMIILHVTGVVGAGTNG